MVQVVTLAVGCMLGKRRDSDEGGREDSSNGQKPARSQMGQ